MLTFYLTLIKKITLGFEQELLLEADYSSYSLLKQRGRRVWSRYRESWCEPNSINHQIKFLEWNIIKYCMRAGPWLLMMTQYLQITVKCSNSGIEICKFIWHHTTLPRIGFNQPESAVLGITPQIVKIWPLWGNLILFQLTKFKIIQNEDWTQYLNNMSKSIPIPRLALSRPQFVLNPALG